MIKYQKYLEVKNLIYEALSLRFEIYGAPREKVTPGSFAVYGNGWTLQVDVLSDFCSIPGARPEPTIIIHKIGNLVSVKKINFEKSTNEETLGRFLWALDQVTKDNNII